MWVRMGVNDPGFEPFGGTVHEFQLALEEELGLDYEEEPGAQFLRNLRGTRAIQRHQWLE